MPKNLKEDSEDCFYATIKGAEGQLVLVDFHATWCPPCRMIAPALTKLEEDNNGKVFVLKVDVDECGEVARVLGIESMPTFLFYVNGKMVEKFSGANEQMLKDLVKQHLGATTPTS